MQNPSTLRKRFQDYFHKHFVSEGLSRAPKLQQVHKGHKHRVITRTNLEKSRGALENPLRNPHGGRLMKPPPSRSAPGFSLTDNPDRANGRGGFGSQTLTTPGNVQKTPEKHAGTANREREREREREIESWHAFQGFSGKEGSAAACDPNTPCAFVRCRDKIGEPKAVQKSVQKSACLER